MTKKLNIISGIAVAILALLFGSIAYGAVTARIVNQATGFSQNYTFFSATTTNATSTTGATVNDPGFFVIAGAKRVDMFFSRAATSTNNGTSTFAVQVTPDGTNWYDFGRLTQATSTNLQPTVRIGQSTSTVMAGVDLRTDNFYGIRCIVTFTVDGNESCKAQAEF